MTMAYKYKLPISVERVCDYMTSSVLKSYEYQVADGKKGIEISGNIWGELDGQLQQIVDQDDYTFGTSVTVPIQAGDFIKVLTNQKLEGEKSVEFYRLVKFGNDEKYYVSRYMKANDITNANIRADGSTDGNCDTQMYLSFYVMSPNMSGYNQNMDDTGTKLSGKAQWKGGKGKG